MVKLLNKVPRHEAAAATLNKAPHVNRTSMHSLGTGSQSPKKQIMDIYTTRTILRSLDTLSNLEVSVPWTSHSLLFSRPSVSKRA